MNNPEMINTDAMYAKQNALYQEGVARSIAMGERDVQEQTKSLMKFPIKELDDIRFH